MLVRAINMALFSSTNPTKESTSKWTLFII
jgi:hypothetical protein